MQIDETPGVFDDDDDEATKITKFTTGAKNPVVKARTASLVVVYVPLDRASAQADLGRRIPIEGVVTVGRSAGNVLTLEQDDVSRKHAEFLERDGRFVVRDLGSRNGTAVNDHLLQNVERPLNDGDRVQIGSNILKFIQSETDDQFHEIIYRLKVEDALTGIHNKRYLLEFLERETSRALRHRSPLSLILFDLDFFKRINDGHGHLAGDSVLRGVSAIVKSMVRKEECFARYGGEEFALVQPEVSLAAAARVAEKIRVAIGSHSFEWNGNRLPVTVSLGVAELGPGIADSQEFIAAADARLYAAKHRGRNCVVDAG